MGILLRLQMDFRQAPRRPRSLPAGVPHRGAGTRGRIDHKSFVSRGRTESRTLGIPLECELA